MGVCLVVVEKVFGVVDDFLFFCFELGYCFVDYGEVFLYGDFEDFFDV